MGTHILYVFILVNVRDNQIATEDSRCYMTFIAHSLYITYHYNLVLAGCSRSLDSPFRPVKGTGQCDRLQTGLSGMP
jgi:hypothetical protein